MAEAHKNETSKKRERSPGSAPPANHGGDSSHKDLLNNLPAYRVLTEAIRAVPPVRYALGIAGVIAVIAIVTALGVDLRVAALGAPVLLVLMVVLVVFRNVVRMATPRFALPALIFVWSSLMLVIATAVLLLTSVFFNKPVPLRDFIHPNPVISTNQSAADLERESQDIARAKQLSKAALAQAEAGDYAGAWATISNAVSISPRTDQLRSAQTQVAMMWMRDMHVLGEQHNFSEYVDPLLPCLSELATSSTGATAADALAHIGWGYYLKYREGNRQLAVEAQFERAVSMDPANPYAQSMWGFWILWNNGPMEEATNHFAKALSSGREQRFARGLEVHGLMVGVETERPECAVSLIRVWDVMRKSKETLPTEERARAIASVYWGSMGDSVLIQLGSILPPAEHLATFTWLIEGTHKDDSSITMFWRARLTEATGDYSAALPLYLKASSAPFTFGEDIQQGIKRCRGHSSAAH